MITWIIAFYNSVKLGATPCKFTKNGRVMEKSFHKTGSTGEENGKSLQDFCLENPISSMKKQKDTTLKDESSRLLGIKYATGEEERNSSRRNDKTEPKWKWCPVVHLSGDESKVWHCKKQYCIGTWNVRSMNQGELEVVKEEMASWTSTF